MDSLIKNYGDSLALISYNRTFADSLVHESRWNYYGITTEPAMVMDGTNNIYVENPNGYYSTYNSYIQYAKGTVPILNLYIGANIDSTDSTIGNIYLRIVPTDTLPAGSVAACVTICQDSIDGAYKYFNYVCQQFYSFPVSLVFPDSTDTTLTFTHGLPANKLRAVVFVQDLETKEILQAATTKFIY